MTGKKKLNYRRHEGSTCHSHYTQFLDEFAHSSDTDQSKLTTTEKLKFFLFKR